MRSRSSKVVDFGIGDDDIMIKYSLHTCIHVARICPHSKCRGRLRKMQHAFPEKVRNGSSRSAKVVDFGTNDDNKIIMVKFTNCIRAVWICLQSVSWWAQKDSCML